MKKILILGTCACCAGKTEKNIKQKLTELEIKADVVWSKDIEAISAYGIMKTPAVIIDDVLVHEGGVPSEEIISSWFGK